MADVLIVCVREDEPQAKALANMFEAAGFSIGGAPSNDAALRSSGAGVVVWSQASIRSRPFLDAAQRVINSGKAVVASLIEPPPPSSIGDSPAFDLSRWDGDPNDPSLDSLFFAVDRMVNTARAAVSASPAQPPAPAYEPPPAPPPQRAAPTKPSARQAPAREPPPPREPARRPAPGSDPLEAETEHWRAIRDSRDPADFMDYLARYGTDGAFSEVAEIKLKRLTGSEPRAAEPRPSMRGPLRPEPPAVRRPAEPAAARWTEPAPRRLEAGMRPPIDRGLERATDFREPPSRSQGGGALRAFVLIGLLGGAATAAFVWFGRDLPSATQSAASTAELSESSEEGPPSLDSGTGVSLSDATLNDVGATRREPPPPARRQTPPQQQQQPQRTAAAQTQEREATPPPFASWNGAEASGGPVSLVPGQQQNVPGGAAAQDQQPVQLAANNVTSATQPPGPAPRVLWTQTFSARRMAELYPASAAANGAGGRVVLDCVVQPALNVQCTVVSANPQNAGFDRAAQRLAGYYRARATRSDGSSAVGQSTRIAVNFQPPSR
jgi:outer membrane biosynthesis protein TonB